MFLARRKAKEMARHIRRRDKYGRQKEPKGRALREKTSFLSTYRLRRNKIIEPSNEKNSAKSSYWPPAGNRRSRFNAQLTFSIHANRQLKLPYKYSTWYDFQDSFYIPAWKREIIKSLIKGDYNWNWNLRAIGRRMGFNRKLSCN